MSDDARFSIDVRVYYEDTDGAGIVYYASYLRFMERARTEWLRRRGFEHGGVRERFGVVFTVSRLAVSYRAPARLDDRLAVRAGLTRRGRASFWMDQSVTRADELLCDASVRIACVDAGSLRPVALPEPILSEL